MSDINTTFEAGIDAVLADNTINKGGFADALRTVATARWTDTQARAWVDSLAVEYNRVGQINNPTYGSLRGSIISDGKALAKIRFEALFNSVSALSDTTDLINSLTLVNLRTERDDADANIDILIALKDGQPKQVRDAIQVGVEQLRAFKQQVRLQIQAITGDGDN